MSWNVLRILRRDPRKQLWEPRFDGLSTYNGEVARGIVHTPEWDLVMKRLQEEYNARMRRLNEEHNAKIRSKRGAAR